ncbi:MAG: hypothetical protein ACFFGZ_20180 [Candidatus Thorarchaeota archaeon]
MVDEYQTNTRKLNGNERVFFYLILLSVFCQLLITPFLYGDVQLIVNWIGIPFYGLFGYLGLKKFEKRAGFPDMLDDSIDNRQRFLFPLVLGTLFGLAAILFDIFSTNKIPQIAFPLSIPVWIPIAILDEMFWRLFVMTFLVWLFSEKALKGANQESVFWVVAIIETLIYMMMQFSLYTQNVGPITTYVVMQVLLVSGSFILVACYLYRRVGFLGPITLHIGQYMLYHGVYGGISILL